MQHNIINFLKPYKYKIIFVIFFTFIETLLNLLIPSYISNILTYTFDNSTFNQDNFLKVIILMIIISIVSLILSLLIIYITSLINSGFSRDLRRAIFTKIINLKKQDRRDLSISSNLTRTINDVQQLQIMLSMILRMGLLAPAITITGLIISYNKEPKLTFILLIISTILSLFIIFLGKKVIPINKRIQKKVDYLNLVSREIIFGVKTVRSFNKQAYSEEKFANANKSLYKEMITSHKYMVLMIPFSMMIMNLYTIICLYIGHKFVLSTSLNPSEIVAFIQYGTQILFGFIMLSVVWTFLPRASVSINRIEDILNIKENIKDISNPIHLKNINEIKFQNVSFKMGDSDKYILKDINFEIKNGEKIGIIGSIGAGKSSLFNLILRNYYPTKGNILINGNNIKDIYSASIYEKIAYVPQKTTLFKGNIKENLLFGNPQSNEQQMYNALEFADIEELVTNEKKLNYDIDYQGKNLSGGQKQRMSIARSVIKNSDVYLLDDSMSALDFEVSKNILDNFKKLFKEKIIILITQRISNLIDMDKIIVINDGEIENIGTHKYLLKESKIYKQIFKLQFDN